MALGRARVSVSHGFVSHLEAGRRYPSPRVLDALAVALEMQPSALEHGANLWTGVFADGRLAATSAETVGDACRKLARAGELVMLFAGEPVPVWRAT
jgi:transcriptional regulator with XRE-family HTH domain